MKRVNLGQHPYPHSLVYIHRMCICIEAKNTTIALVDTHRTPPGAMASASGSSPGSDPLPSMSQNQDTLSCATASYQLTPPSAMEPTSTCTGGVTGTTEVSGLSGPCWPSGAPSPTGCSPSTSETPCWGHHDKMP